MGFPRVVLVSRSLPGQPSKGLVVVPGHLFLGVFFAEDRVAQEGDEVLEGVGVVEFGGVDEVHEDIADMGAVLGFVEQGVLTVKDGAFEDPFA